MRAGLIDGLNFCNGESTVKNGDFVENACKRVVPGTGGQSGVKRNIVEEHRDCGSGIIADQQSVL